MPLNIDAKEASNCNKTGEYYICSANIDDLNADFLENDQNERLKASTEEDVREALKLKGFSSEFDKISLIDVKLEDPITNDLHKTKVWVLKLVP